MQRTIRNRVSLLVVAVVLLGLGVGWRLTDIQVLNSETFRHLADLQHERDESVLAQRGAIVDRRGRDLAVTVRTYALYVNKHRLEDVRAAASRVARVLGVPESRLRREIEATDRKHYRLEHGIGPETARALRALDLFGGPAPAFELEAERERSYPHDRLASHVVGFAGADLIGWTGIEQARNDTLMGTPERRRVRRDGRGEGIVEEILPAEKPHHDVMLTLDLVLQHVVERELDRAMADTGAAAASAVLLDPKTGEVLALANRPAPRLSDFGAAPAAVQRNRATYDLYEPGSTFKAFAAAALLEAGRVRPDSRFDCENGAWRYRGVTVRDHEPFDSLTFREILEHSSNVGMVKASLGMPGAELDRTLRRFGFGETTGVPLSERAGGIADLAGNEINKLWATFGYGVNVTLMQLASATAALANEGVRVPPSLIRATRGPDGRWVPESHRSGVRVVSPTTARTVSGLLEGVVERGTGRGAAVPGYRVAGKTGTTKRHVENAGYVAGRYWASFVGYAPAEQPRIVLAIVLDSPRSSIYGGSTAAPVFSRIATDALAYLRVPPSPSQIVLLPPAEARPDASGIHRASSAGGSR